MTAISQRNSATHKDTHQEIEQHEKELKDLLNRVLREPLRSAFGEFGIGSRLDELKDAVEKLSKEELPALMGGNEETSRKEFSKLKRLMEEEVNGRLDGLHEQLSPGGQPLGDTVVNKLTGALEARLDRLVQQMGASHLALTEAQAAWQKSQEGRQQELCGLQARVSTQLTSVGKSLRTMQILTLGMAAISAVGVVAMMVRLFQ